MGQTCKTGVISCMDCADLNSHELNSEASKKFEIYSAISRNLEKDPVIECVERLNKPLSIYEKEFSAVKREKERKCSSGLDDSFRSRGSPRLKILSSNVSEKSVNIIDKIDRTAETDKTSSSIFFSPQTK